VALYFYDSIKIRVHPATLKVQCMKFSNRDSAFALSIIVIWGLNFVVMKWALHDFTPLQLGAARYVLAALPLVFFIKPPRVAPKWVLLYGLCQGVGQFGLLFTALKFGMTASLASVLMQTQVFFTALFGMLWLSERLKNTQWIGLALAALGLTFFAMHFVAAGAQSMDGVTVLAFVLNLCAAASWAVSNIVARKAQQASPDYDPLAFIVWASLVPVLPFVLLTTLLDDPAVRWRWTQAPVSAWLGVVYLGWVATIAGYAMWTTLLKRHPASRVAPLSLGVPVVGIAAGISMLGEHVSSWQWAGVLCVVSALAVALFGDVILKRIGFKANRI
jgi:O-acetylserine/cysteine efflux transporter